MTAHEEALEVLDAVAAPALANVETVGGEWIADPLALEDTMTRDGRVFAPRSLYWNRVGEMSLMAQFQNPESGGHALAVLAGTMPGGKIKRQENVITSRGVFNTDDNGQQAEEYVTNRSLTGISIDVAPQEWQMEIQPTDDDEGGIFFFAKDDEESPKPDGPIILESKVDDIVIRFTKAEIIGATLVSTPAFGEAQVSMSAGAHGYPVPERVTLTGYVRMADTAAAASGLDVSVLERLVSALDRAQVAGLVSEEDAKAMFMAATTASLQ